MQSSGQHPIRVLVAFLAVAAAALILFWASSDARPTEALNNFDATFTVKNCNALPPIAPWTGAFPGYPGGIDGADLTGPGGAGGPDGIADCTPGQSPTAEILATNTTADLTNRLCLPGRVSVADCAASAFGPNLGAKNFSSVINYVPNGYQINCKGACPGSMASDAGLGADLDVGEFVGGGDNSVNLQAATQGQCTSNFNVPFFFYNVALPDTPADPRASGNIAFPRNEGQPDRNGAWLVGAVPPDGGADNVTDANADNKADSGTTALANYPSYLLDLFDPDFLPGTGDNADGGANLIPVLPIAVYGGLTQPVPASTDWTALYFVQFAPGALATGTGLWTTPHPFSRTAAALGAPNVAVLNDPTAVKGSVSAIQDFCTVVRSTTMLVGTGGNGHTRFKTPTAAGTYFSQNIVVSQRDADGDGRENAFDTCALTSDGPATWDTDLDGINDSCDPDPGVSCCSGDFDGDGFSNEQDNCPQVDNGVAPTDPGDNGQKDSELGVASYASAAPDGGVKTDSIGDLCEANDLVANGAFQLYGQVSPKCIGGTDADADGYCVADKDVGQDAVAARHNVWTSPLTLADTDQDLAAGVKSDWAETFMGTDGAQRCAADTTANNEGTPDRWAFDFDDDRKAALGDILKYIPVFNTNGTPRWDQNQDGRTDLADILSFIPVFNVSCTPTP